MSGVARLRARRPPAGRSHIERTCARLLEQWDPMFAATVDPTRFRRMDAIVDILGRRRSAFTVLDIGSGPGSLVARLLAEFQGATVIALDTDPALLRIGEQALRRFRGRVRWVIADVREKDWRAALPVRKVDVVVSSLTLHWLETAEIRRLYRSAHDLFRPGGLLVNADFLPRSRSAPGGSHGRTPIDTGGPTRRGSGAVRAFKSKWAGWWGAVEDEPSLRGVLYDRSIRMPGSIPPRRTTGPRRPASLEFHVHALGAAGFRSAQIRWEDGEFRALAATR